MKKVLCFLAIGFCAAGVFAQKTKSTSKSSVKTVSAVLTPKKQLEDAVIKSKRSEKVRVIAELSLGANEVISIFDYVSPDKFYLLEKVSGKTVKEAIEISKQRYQKKNEQWIKTRLDYFPLRDQFGDVFRIKFVSKRDDAIKVKKVTVASLGEATLNDKKYQKYRYSILYDDSTFNESGTAWVNQSNGLLERCEVESVGLFGQSKSVWNYIYDKEIKIESPKVFVEKDWVD
ncbi:MAG TPA: hypothetical protein PKY59_19770 [Pyrinomonadaceae bacterium]|nr:hypothetical protein [Pyrinomonadaceae bacterium]